MSEFIGFAYYAEIPSVFIDVQRVGPSTGMPTRTQQCDVMLCAYASHGDTKHPILFPANPHECFEMAVTRFDLAERLQTPVFLLSDLDIGMNDWMVPELTWDDSYRPDRGKVLGRKNWQRWNASFATSMWTVTASPTAPCRVKTPRAPTLSAVRATIVTVVTPRIQTNTRT